MLFRIPSISALEVALATGAIPERIVTAPAEAKLDLDGSLHVRAAGRMSAALTQQLEPFGITVEKGIDLPPSDSQNVATWFELIPLKKADIPARALAGRVVLFEAGDADSIVPLVSELLQLGNDRQALAQLSESGRPRTLIRVVGPPYYTVLRAIDESTAHSGGLRGYLESSPGLWIELGESHPLVERIVPPPDQWIFLTALHGWRRIPIPEFEDLYDVAEFALPSAGKTEVTPSPVARFQIPLRLRALGGEETADLWVLCEDALAALEEFVEASDDELLNRLAFAVADDAGERRVLVRARPGTTPPVVVFNGLPLRRYQKLDNLFVPCGSRLEPPLRRDALQKLLADSPDHLTWLEPTGNDSFRTLQISEEAFRPLTDWVDYVLDSNRQTLDAWSDSFQFEFDAYVCDDTPSTPSVAPHPGRIAEFASHRLAVGTSNELIASADEPETTNQTAGDTPHVNQSQVEASTSAAPGFHAGADESAAQSHRERGSDLELLEEKFLAVDGPFDAPERQLLWRALAMAHEAAGRPEEAVACWLHILWDETSLSSTDLETCRRMTRANAALPATVPTTSTEVVDSLLNQANPTPAALLCAVIEILSQRITHDADASSSRTPPLPAYLPSVLERHDHLLPVRAAWMGHRALAEDTGDVLGLARARDRVLERLHRQGLDPRRDLPRFLRDQGRRAGERFDRLRTAAGRLATAGCAWIDRETQAAKAAGGFKLDTARTADYADLLFACALAHLGSRDASHEAANRATSSIRGLDPVHDWLLDALLFRVDAAHSGESNTALPADLLARLRQRPLDELRIGPHRIPSTVPIDQFRRISQTLDPRTARGAFGESTTRLENRQGDRLSLRHAADESARMTMAQSLLREISNQQAPHAERASALDELLDNAPLAGALIIEATLPHVAAVVAASPGPAIEIRLLERALVAAAEFDFLQFVPGFIDLLLDRFERLLSIKRNPQDLEPLASLLGHGARALRRMGLSEQTGRMCRSMERIILDAERRGNEQAAGPKAKRPPADEPANESERRIVSLVLLLKLAPARASLGDESDVIALLDEAGRIAFEGEQAAPGIRPAYRLLLIRTFIEAAASLDLDSALARLERVFHDLHGIHRPSTSDSHFSMALITVVDAVVQALVGSELAHDPAMRRLLDDNEYVVRRRIHADMKRMHGS